MENEISRKKIVTKKIITAEDKNKISGRKAIIPEIGSKLRIEEDWEFPLFKEHRNKDIFNADNMAPPLYKDSHKSYPRTLPAKTEFLVDRIYVRNGLKDFSSITLKITSTTDANLNSAGMKNVPFKSKNAKDKKSYGRFWVKLGDFNKANMTIIDDTVLIGKMKTVKGEIATFGEISKKGKKQLDFWVEFTDKNFPENSFAGVASSYHAKRKFHVPNQILMPTGFVTDVRNIKEHIAEYPPYNYGYEPAKYKIVDPQNLFTYGLIPHYWHDNHKNGTATQHPYEKLLRIPKNQAALNTMGIVDKFVPMANIPIGEGLSLSIFKLAEIEIFEQVEEVFGEEEERTCTE